MYHKSLMDHGLSKEFNLPKRIIVLMVESPGNSCSIRSTIVAVKQHWISYITRTPGDLLGDW